MVSGVNELVRINSAVTNAFVHLAWVPAILPSSTLGSVCNSMSSCYCIVASDGTALRYKSAIIELIIAKPNYYPLPLLFTSKTK